MFTFQNERYTLQFDEQAGAIDSLTDRGQEFVAKKTAVFRLSTRDEDAGQEIFDTGDFTLLRSAADEGSFTAVYGREGLTVTVSAEAGNEIRWHIAVEVPENRVAEWVNFPQIVVPDALKDRGGDAKILWGFNEGVIVDDLDLRQKNFPYLEPTYPSLGVMGMYPAIVESQCMAYWNDRGGLYFAAHDPDDCLKGIDFYRVEGGILLQFRQFCGARFGQRYEMSFPMVMNFFTGPWQTAAELYRVWLDGAKTLPRILENRQLPAWYGQSPVVVTYPVRGVHDTDDMAPNKLYPYANVIPHIERLEKAFGSKILVLLMHWEGTAPWAPPYVWPPFGGEAEFRAFADMLHARGDILGVYCSGMGWTQQSNLIAAYNKTKEFNENHLEDVMCLSPEQTLPLSRICTAQRSGYDLCPTQDFTVRTLQSEVAKMTAAGIDYIQLLDQNHGGTSYFCYSKKHGHPPVPGKWQVDAVKKLLKTVEEGTGSVLFGCESAAAEAYLPQLLFSDNRFNLNYVVGRPVPLYAYLYHQYVNNFMGNQVCSVGHIQNDKSPFSALERLTYSFVAGDMMTVILNQDGGFNWSWGQRDMNDQPDQESIVTLVRNLNLWRQGSAAKYLHTGRMVLPAPVSCKEMDLVRNDGSVLKLPAVHTSAWLAEDGTLGQILANYTWEPVTCRVRLPEGDCTLYETPDCGSTLPGGTAEITVPPLSACLIVRA